MAELNDALRAGVPRRRLFALLIHRYAAPSPQASVADFLWGGTRAPVVFCSLYPCSTGDPCILKFAR